MATDTPAKIRDADRSRESILAAAERFFADHGYEGASLNDIATEAGLSRGTPSYFFGSKHALYAQVIERTFAAREEAVRQAFEPVREWCRMGSGIDALRTALTSAVEDYVAFLANRPTFVRLIMREELSGGVSLMERKGRSTAMEEAFAALRDVSPERGLASFSGQDAVLVFVVLTFAPVSYSNTLMRAIKRDLAKASSRKHQVELAVSQLMYLLTG